MPLPVTTADRWEILSDIDGEAGGPCTRGELASRARAVRALPCQNRNNSTEAWEAEGLEAGKQALSQSAYNRKAAFVLEQNIEHMISLFGVDRVGFLTLTFADSVSLREGNRRFNSFRRVLAEIFPFGWVAVREWSKSGRLHFHLVGVSEHDLRTGFDWGVAGEMARLQRDGYRKNAGMIRKLARMLNPSDALRRLWAMLREMCPRYRFGRSELMPVRKSGEAISRYLGFYLGKGVDSRPPEAKGARLVTYSRNFPRRAVGHKFMFLGGSADLWRSKLDFMADLWGLADIDGFSERFGPNWVFWLRDLIWTLNTGADATLTADFAKRLAPFVVAYPDLDSSRLHTVPPRPPITEDGKAFPVPALLAYVFERHSRMWAMPRQEWVRHSRHSRAKLAHPNQEPKGETA